MKEFDYKQRPGTKEYEIGYVKIFNKCKCPEKPLTGVLVKGKIVCPVCKKEF